MADSDENHQVIDEEKEDDEITSTPDNSVSMPAVEEDINNDAPSRDKINSYKEVLESASTDTFVRKGTTATVMHLRHLVKTSVIGGREYTILRRQTSEDGRRTLKESRIRYSFVRNLNIVVETETNEDQDQNNLWPIQLGTRKRKHSDTKPESLRHN